ncbi:MAG: YgfZ/GcvT domain-containing protein [Actinomycetota bacterium]
MTTPNGVELLASGAAFVDASSRRTVAVSGAQALGWLNDLASAALEDLTPGRSRRSLLLSPTGAVRAEFTVAMVGDDLLLIQDPRQPRPIETLLAPYVLSSGIRVADRTGDFAIYSFPGRDAVPHVPETTRLAPSCLGSGADLVGPAEHHDRLANSLAEVFDRASEADAEAWRVAAAVPLIGVDTSDGDLPAECALEDAVAFDKGCFLGQESVAKMRNLGHPRRSLLALEGEGSIARDETIFAGDTETGQVTSVARSNGRTLVLAQVRWEHRDEPLRTGGGVQLRLRIPFA